MRVFFDIVDLSGGGTQVKSRIKQIRKSFGLTQVEFGAKIGVKGNTITNYENGLRNPTDAVILSICREFDVNEEWLRYGIGEMFITRTRSQVITDFAGDLILEEDESFKKRFIEALSQLDTNEWKLLEGIALKLSKKS